MKSWPPYIRNLSLAAIYFGLLSGSLFGAFLLRFDFNVPPEFLPRMWNSLIWIVPLKISFLAILGQFRSMLTFFSLPDAKRLLLAMTGAALIELLLWYLSSSETVPPRGVIVTDLVISLAALSGLRAALRIYRERFVSNTGTETAFRQKRRRTVIIGAGTAGATLLMEILSKPGLGIEVACFLDDDPAKAGTMLHGRRIIGAISVLPAIIKREGITKAIIAMPAASQQVIRGTVKMLNELGLEHDILPSVTQILRGSVTVSHLRHVEPEDLLGREPEALDDEGIQHLVEGRVVLVTGAGGSIGSELCRQIVARSPLKLLLVDRSEPALYAIEQELLRESSDIVLEPIAVSVTDESGIEKIFQTHKPHLVLHAAAHKHVPMMERQPAEAILNNVIGTYNVARCSHIHEVRKCVLVSTDKAVNPTNVMGATKRVAELIWSAFQGAQEGRIERKTIFASVRFGNVLGSSGSVIPTFKEQIARGGPVMVTHPEINRYFMSIPEAAGLVLQCSLLCEGGEVFVLDMGEPIRIQDLAVQMIEMCGFRPNQDIKIEFSGLRPGEKLYEEAIHQAEDIKTTSHPKIKCLISYNQNSALLDDIKTLRERLNQVPSTTLRDWLKEKVPEYKTTV